MSAVHAVEMANDLLLEAKSKADGILPQGTQEAIFQTNAAIVLLLGQIALDIAAVREQNDILLDHYSGEQDGENAG